MLTLCNHPVIDPTVIVDCGLFVVVQALMTKLMRRAQTYAPVLRRRSSKARMTGDYDDVSFQRLRENFLSFVPRTWIVPGDAAVLANEMNMYSKLVSRYTQRKVTYIVKPDGGARGDGIFLASNYQDIE